VIGRWPAATSAALIIGPLLGGVLVDALGWRAVFAVNVVPALATLALLRHVSEPATAGRGTVDVAGSALAVVGLDGLVLGLIEAGHAAAGTAVPDAAIVAGVLGLAGFVLRESRARAPMLPLGLFRRVTPGPGTWSPSSCGAACGSVCSSCRPFFSRRPATPPSRRARRPRR
jgi:MFS family permease